MAQSRSRKFKFSPGDRVDFLNADGSLNRTPGTVKHRAFTQVNPSYRVAWDDGNTDNDLYPEAMLAPLAAGSS